ncbi:MAG: DUF1552 domain-containing protein [Sandaracinaceae bacterium]
MKRRTFLRGLFGVTVATPFLGSLGRLTAQGEVAPKRLVIFLQPNGVNINEFWPTGGPGPLTAASMAGRGVAPLAGFADRLLIPRGIHMSPRGFGLDGVPGCDHKKGMACKLTARPLADDGRNYALGHSVDFEAARHIHADGADPLVLHVGRNADPTTGNATDFCSYRGANDPYPGENNPWNVYRSMLGILPGGEADDFLRRRRNSLNDLVRDDLADLRRLPLGSEDQQRLSDWQDLIRDTEMGMAELCSAEAPDTLGITGRVERYDGMDNGTVGSDAEYRQVGELMLRLIALSMVCDHRRVITLQWSRGSGGPTFRWDGLSHEFTHHQLSHRNGRDDDQGGDLPGIERLITEVDTWYGERFAELLGLLTSFTEGDGTVLDHSAVMWINELSDGKAHHFNNLPVVIAGSAAGYLRQGRVVDCSAGGDVNALDGAPHNRLLTTLLNAVGATGEGGAPLASFGDLDYGEPGEFDPLKA